MIQCYALFCDQTKGECRGAILPDKAGDYVHALAAEARADRLQRAIEEALQDEEFAEPDRWIDILRDALKEVPHD